MANIPNTAYITVKRGDDDQVGIFVGGKPTTTYRGVEIYGTSFVIEDAFARIQKYDPNVTELHVLSSETLGEYAMVGNPSPEHGRYAWCRVKMKGGTVGGWVRVYGFSSASYCAYDCTARCAYHVWGVTVIRRAVLLAALDTLTNALKGTDLSELIGTHTIGSYEIVVRKSGNTRG